MKGKVILELEEYEELVRKNSNHIDTIIEKTKHLNVIVDKIDTNIIKKIYYFDGSYNYYIDTNVQRLLDTREKQFIKTTTILQFIKLKRGRK